tara:strand:+ start:321 stop:605 length:285 start_codon:yes stop_codon:yes gene_type:complete
MKNFNNRKEIEEYFKDEVFKFAYMSDNMMTFETLNPKNIHGNFYNFELVFCYSDHNSFFAYSSLTEWLDCFEIIQVIIKTVGNEAETKLFTNYK